MTPAMNGSMHDMPHDAGNADNAMNHNMHNMTDEQQMNSHPHEAMPESSQQRYTSSYYRIKKPLTS